MEPQKKTWGMTEGGLVCFALMLVGIVLQLAVGPVCWEMMAWPLNGLALLLLLTGIALMHALRGRIALFRWMATLHAGIPALLMCAMMTILLGVTRQVPAGHVPAEPIGITSMLSFWPFVLSYVWLMLLVGMVCATRLVRPKKQNIPFLLHHLGIFIALVAGTLGSADMQRLRMVVQEGKTEWRAVDDHHRIHHLPIAIELHDFSIIQEPELSFSSDVTLHAKNGIIGRDTVLVNKPFSAKGWKIYQFSYDEAKGNQSDISVFELVRDPWLPVVYVGIFMMLAGALSIFFSKK